MFISIYKQEKVSASEQDQMFLKVEIVSPSGVRGVKRISYDRFVGISRGNEYGVEESDITVSTLKSSYDCLKIPQEIRLSDSKLEGLVQMLSEFFPDLEKSVQKETEELVVRSNFDEVLHLPWEKLVNEGVGVLREVLASQEFRIVPGRKNVLMALSHSSIDVGGEDLGNISGDFCSESGFILNALWKEPWTNSVEGPRLLQLVKHLNTDVLQGLDFSGCDILHLMMHGQEDEGNLALEEKEDPSKIEWCSKEIFVELVKEKIVDSFLLVFFASCYSANCVDEKPSLTFMFIEHGISKYSIGFSRGIGSKNTLPAFVEEFYARFFVKKEIDIEDAFYQSIKKLREVGNQYWDSFRLYKLKQL